MQRVIAHLVLAAVATTSTAAYAQTSDGSNRVVSPTTVAYWQQHVDKDGIGSLDLLVLWRGTSSWYSGGIMSASGHLGGGFGHWEATRWMTYGDIVLTMDWTSQSQNFDAATTILTVLGQQIALREVNVVLIDGVGSSTPNIVATRHVDPRFTGKDAVGAVVQRTRELFDFVGCQIPLPEMTAPMYSAMVPVCGQTRP